MADNYFMLMEDGVWEEISIPHYEEIQHETFCGTPIEVQLGNDCEYYKNLDTQDLKHI